MAISHQPRKIHKKFIAVDKHPGCLLELTITLLKGHIAYLPNLNSCRPKGIPIIVTQNIPPNDKVYR